MNRLASSPKNMKEMFNELGYIMKNCSKDEVGNAIEGFFNKFANEDKILDYFQKNLVFGDKISKFTYSFFCFHFCVS